MRPSHRLRPAARLLLAASALVAAGCAGTPSAPAPAPAPAASPGRASLDSNRIVPNVRATGIGAGFATRGVIEGFYGPPWSYQDRLDMVRFMGRVGMNAYFYGPKDDPYHRERWREPYPADQIARLGEIVRVGRDAGVDVWFAVSPGLSMRYSDSTDYAALLAKLDAVAAVGVRHVALFVDDVPETLAHPEDRAKFTSLAAAHGALVRALKRDLDTRGLALAVVPTTYTNSFGSKEYAAELGRELPADVPLAWTGTDVVAPDMTAAEANAWGAIIRRKPLIWDNYPVNDFARWRLFLGPLRNRGGTLGEAVNGFLANPMNEAHASMLPLWTVADYLRNPAGYQPDSSLAHALIALYGADGAAAMQPFVDAYGDDWPTPSPVEGLFIPSRGIDVAKTSSAVQGMRTGLERMAELARTDSATWTPLIRELTPFVDSTDARLVAVQRDTMYARRGNRLVFRRELDRISAVHAKRMTLDGVTTEWPRAAWRPLFSRDRLAARVAMAADATTLYIALDVKDTSVTTFARDTATAGDNVAIVVAGDPSGAETRMTERDLLIVATPASATREAAVGGRVLAITPFFQDIIVAREGYVFPQFLIDNFTTAVPEPMSKTVDGARVASTRTASGWTMEIALPRAGLPVVRAGGTTSLRLALVVSDAKPGPRRTASLGPRNYPANPQTYTEVTLPR